MGLTWLATASANTSAGWKSAINSRSNRSIPSAQQMLAQRDGHGAKAHPGCHQASVLHRGDGQREQRGSRLQSGGDRRTPVHDHQSRHAIPYSRNRYQRGGDAARRSIRPVARRRTVPSRQGFGGRLRPIPEAAQNAALQRDYGLRWRAASSKGFGWRDTRVRI